MRSMLALGLLAACALVTHAAAAPHPLVGTWRVISSQVHTEGVEDDVVTQKEGFLIITPEHRLVAFVADRGNRPATNEAEALALSKKVITYTGKVTVHPDRYTFMMDLSSTQRNLDQPQTRYYRIDGDNLTINSPLHDSIIDPGRRSSTILKAVREK